MTTANGWLVRRALLALALMVGFYVLALGVAAGLLWIPYAGFSTRLIPWRPLRRWFRSGRLEVPVELAQLSHPHSVEAKGAEDFGSQIGARLRYALAHTRVPVANRWSVPSRFRAARHHVGLSAGRPAIPTPARAGRHMHRGAEPRC